MLSSTRGTLRSALRQQLRFRSTNNSIRSISSVTSNHLTNHSDGYHAPLCPLQSATKSTWFPNKHIRSFSTASSDDTTASNTKDEEKDEAEEEPTPIEFQAETRQLLDIVTNSLYTDKEVFLRELVSNASDALEKLRHAQQSQSEPPVDPDVPLEIHVETDEVNGTLTVRDTGVGLEREEMVSCLGTIARSGSRAFVSEMETSHGEGAGMDASRGIIGRFGVGFYSAFMVGDKVDVRSQPAYPDETSEGPLVWSSAGIGTYSISSLSKNIRQNRGSSIVIHLKDNAIQYTDEKNIETILKKYSNFVNFPIYLNGNRVNTMEAIWAEDPKSVSEEKYSDFYKYVANAFDEPLDRMHYRADAPVEIKALFYIPSFHSEKYGMGRMDSGVSLYSRKVLIEHAKSADILPEWLRFIKGVVDSEDLPLSISREKPQDSALIAKIRTALTRKFINHLAKMAKKDPSKYKDEFYNEYSFFLKEGICQDYEVQEPLSKLLFFETNKTMNKGLTSFEEYVSRMKPVQKEIYYLCAPNRDMAIQSPYLEAFEKAGREVFFLFNTIDEFVVTNLEKFQGRKLVSAESSDIDFGSDNDENDTDTKEDDGKGDTSATGFKPLDVKQADEFCAWFQTTLDDKVSTCKTTKRLGASPAVITDNESAAMRKMMRAVEIQSGAGAATLPLPKQKVEINPKHDIIVGLNDIRSRNPELAKVVASQVYDNCLVAAGLLDDSRSMLGRLNDILLCVVKGAAVTGEKEEKSKGTSETKE